MATSEDHSTTTILQALINEIQIWRDRNYERTDGTQEYKDGFIKGLTLSQTFIRAMLLKIEEE
jgi:hypothetical protein